MPLKPRRPGACRLMRGHELFWRLSVLRFEQPGPRANEPLRRQQNPFWLSHLAAALRDASTGPARVLESRAAMCLTCRRFPLSFSCRSYSGGSGTFLALHLLLIWGLRIRSLPPQDSTVWFSNDRCAFRSRESGPSIQGFYKPCSLSSGWAGSHVYPKSGLCPFGRGLLGFCLPPCSLSLCTWIRPHLQPMNGANVSAERPLHPSPTGVR